MYMHMYYGTSLISYFYVNLVSRNHDIFSQSGDILRYVFIWGAALVRPHPSAIH